MSPKKESPFKKIVKDIIAGGTAGAAEVGLNHPLWQVKTILQDPKLTRVQKNAEMKNINRLYRGIFANMSSLFAITATQVSVSRALEKLLSASSKQKNSATKEAVAAFAGGSVSALIAGPVEYLMAHQTPKQGFFRTGKKSINALGVKSLGTGFFGTMMRDGIFTLGYLCLRPQLEASALDHGFDANASLVVGGTTGGVVSAVASQPFDTVKTFQQTTESLEKDVAQKEALTFWQTTKTLYAQSGARAFYRGSLPRMVRVAIAVNIVGHMQDHVSEKLKHL